MIGSVRHRPLALHCCEVSIRFPLKGRDRTAESHWINGERSLCSDDWTCNVFCQNQQPLRSGTSPSSMNRCPLKQSAVLLVSEITCGGRLRVIAAGAKRWRGAGSTKHFLSQDLVYYFCKFKDIICDVWLAVIYIILNGSNNVQTTEIQKVTVHFIWSPVICAFPFTVKARKCCAECVKYHLWQQILCYSMISNIDPSLDVISPLL